MTRTRSLFTAALMALALPAAIAGCGGDGGDQDPQEVIDATFNNDATVTSGVLDLSVDASAGDQGSFDASLSGPFQGVEGDPTALPQIDLTATVSGEGAGQSVNADGGLTITDDNVFVEYGGQAYEVGSDTFKQLKDSIETSAGQTQDSGSGDAAASFQAGCEQAIQAQGGDASACDFEPSGWFTNLTNDGTEDLDGTSVVHVSGDVDISQMLDDLVGIAQSVPGAGGQVDQAQVDQVSEAISEASFDIYSGEDDNILRKLDVNVSVDPSAIEGSEVVPVDSVDVGLSVGISDVNEEQTIKGPSGAQPIDELLGQFGLGGGLGGLGALGGGDSFGGGGGSAGTDGGASDAYLDCIAAAGNDAQKAADCLDKL
ncbi:MAG: hypothetical protein ABI726_00040 [bacterium]